MHQAFVPYALPELTSFQVYNLAKEKNLLEIETFYFGEGPKCVGFSFVDANQNGSLRKEKLNLGDSTKLILK
jgi:hypothetical protein